MMPAIYIKRVYTPPVKSDEWRVLVDRLWPRGLTKQAAAIDEWAKDLAPSPMLRKWFGHRPERWVAFCKQYESELAVNRSVNTFLHAHVKKKRLTLLYGASDEVHTHALVLQSYLIKLLSSLQTR